MSGENYYYVKGQKLPCFIEGTAYDNLILGPKDRREKGISPETLSLLKNNSKYVRGSHRCNVSSKDEVYKDPAIRLSVEDLSSPAMNMMGGPVHLEHSESLRSEEEDLGREAVGYITKSWIQDGKLKIVAAVHNPNVAKDMREKKLTGLSIRYLVDRNNENEVTGKIFKELSVCRNPVFPGCKIIDVSASKSGGGDNYGDDSVVSGTGFELKVLHEGEIGSGTIGVGNQIKNLIGDISNVKRTNDKGVMQQQQQQQQARGEGANETLPPTATTAAATTTTNGNTEQSTAFDEKGKGRGGGGGGNEVEDGKETSSSLDVDESTMDRRAYLKYLEAKSKNRELKSKLKEYEAEKNESNMQYVKNQEPKMKSFLEIYSQERGGTVSSDERELIQKSFTNPDFKQWATGLEGLCRKVVETSEENKKLRTQNEELVSQTNALKRKAEKEKSAMKYLKRADGGKKPVTGWSSSSSQGQPEKTTPASKSDAFFSTTAEKEKKSTASNFDISKFNKTASTKKSSRGIENMFAKTKMGGGSVPIDVSASKTGGDAKGEGDDLMNLLNRYSTVSPADDAYKYLRGARPDGESAVVFAPPTYGSGR